MDAYVDSKYGDFCDPDVKEVSTSLLMGLCTVHRCYGLVNLVSMSRSHVHTCLASVHGCVIYCCVVTSLLISCHDMQVNMASVLRSIYHINGIPQTLLFDKHNRYCASSM